MATTATAPRTRAPRPATPERWRQALARAIEKGVQVRQLTGSGAWIATSGTEAGVAHELGVSNGVAHSCTCMAGEFGDPVCCHRARFYHLTGLLDLDAPEPEPEPPAPVAAVALASRAFPCGDCLGHGHVLVDGAGGVVHCFPCLDCEGTGIALAGDDEPADAEADRRHDRPYDADPAPRPIAPAREYALPVVCTACRGATTTAPRGPPSRPGSTSAASPPSPPRAQSGGGATGAPPKNRAVMGNRQVVGFPQEETAAVDTFAITAAGRAALARPERPDRPERKGPRPCRPHGPRTRPTLPPLPRPRLAA